MTAQGLLLTLELLGVFAFALDGALTAMRATTLDLFGVVALGVVTAVGGGILRDVLLAQVPTVLRQELYAVPAMAGAAGFVVVYEAGAVDALAAAIGAALCLAIRLAGLRFDLAVPTEPPPLRPPRRY